MVNPAGRLPAETNGWLSLPVTVLLVPLFLNTVEDCAPLRPTRFGRLLLVMMPLSLGLTKGIPPVIGKRLLLSLENGRPVTSVFATIPATTLADGCDPPRMSCMKKEKDDSFATGFGVTGVALGIAGTTSGVGIATGGMFSAGASVSGTGGSALSSSSPESSVATGLMVVAAGVWPLGKVVAGPTCYDG